MNAIPTILLLTALSIPTPTLVLKSGARIDVDGSIRSENGIVLFRSGGSLYSIPDDEVDFDATRSAGPVAVVEAANEKVKLKVSAADRERLLRELEENHSGTPAMTEQFEIPAASRRLESASTKQEEWQWRSTARQYEEGLRRSREELDLLLDRADRLRSEISGFFNLGYKPSQFTYQTTQLAIVQEQIPRAELEVQRSERAYRQFLDDARRMGILPGWLR